MKRFCQTLTLLVLPLLISGCNTITNLTPRQHVRNPNGLYPFEVKWDSRQQSLRPESLKPSVIIGTETYPMQPLPLVRNRWETLVPIAPDQKLINYRFKFDWEYNAIPKPRQDTKLSAPYQLQIIDK